MTGSVAGGRMPWRRLGYGFSAVGVVEPLELGSECEDEGGLTAGVVDADDERETRIICPAATVATARTIAEMRARDFMSRRDEQELADRVTQADEAEIAAMMKGSAAMRERLRRTRDVLYSAREWCCGAGCWFSNRFGSLGVRDLEWV